MNYFNFGVIFGSVGVVLAFLSTFIIYYEISINSVEILIPILFLACMWVCLILSVIFLLKDVKKESKN